MSLMTILWCVALAQLIEDLWLCYVKRLSLTAFDLLPRMLISVTAAALSIPLTRQLGFNKYAIMIPIFFAFRIALFRLMRLYVSRAKKRGQAGQARLFLAYFSFCWIIGICHASHELLLAGTAITSSIEGMAAPRCAGPNSDRIHSRINNVSFCGPPAPEYLGLDRLCC